MAATVAKAGFGTLLQRGDGGGPEVFTDIAEVKNISGLNLRAETADATHHGSPGSYREVVPTVLDAGEVTVEVNFLPSNATQSFAAGLLLDYANKTKRNFKLVFPGPVTWTFSAYVTAFPVSAPVDGLLTASVTLRITGQPTLA